MFDVRSAVFTHAAFWARDTELLQEIFLRPASIDSMAPGLVSFT